MIRHRWIAAAMLAAANSAFAQTTIEVRGPSAGLGPEIVAHALAGPHVLIERGSAPRVVRRDSAFSQTVITVGRTIVVDGAVHGDLIAIGADVYMHPGATVDGRVVSIGGGVYESMLAHTGDVISFHDFSYAVRPAGNGYILTYEPVPIDSAPGIRFPGPGVVGLHPPAYDRMNGLSVPVAPQVDLLRSGVVIEPGVTYRSQLGRFDPELFVTVPIGAAMQIRGAAERATVTNDAWIRSDLLNSLDFFLLGNDTRNYYRGTRASVTLSGRWRSVQSTFEPYLGARWERARSLPRDSSATQVPWTFLNRGDPDDSRRPNPAIDPATIASVVAGVRGWWTNGAVVASVTANGELGKPALEASAPPTCAGASCSAASFAQLTLDGRIAYPTFGTQSMSVDAHAVVTSSTRTPRQRWSYLGGPGSIPTLELLARGGDELVFVDFHYNIPIERVTLPLVGAPRLTIREILGGAAVGGFPSIAQAVGGRIAVSVFYAELLVDPVSRRGKKGFGISLGR